MFEKKKVMSDTVPLKNHLYMCEFDISSVKDVIFVSVRDGVFTQCKNSLKIAVIIQNFHLTTRLR
jgi:hypothetical protein